MSLSPRAKATGAFIAAVEDNVLPQRALEDISSSCGDPLDLEARSLYQVKIEHAGEADTIFETLMGDVVERRREFIQDYALKMVNPDV